MEIREGIKYEYQPGKTATVIKNVDKKDAYYAKFDNGGFSIDNTSKQWITFFKRKDIKLIEYPYKIGDWILNTHSINDCASGDIFQIVHINGHGLSLFHEKTMVNGKQNPSYFRPCFFEEIPKYKQEKVVKENYDYLIPMLIKLDE